MIHIKDAVAANNQIRKVVILVDNPGGGIGDSIAAGGDLETGISSTDIALPVEPVRP
jgi:hypothetical protein